MRLMQKMTMHSVLRSISEDERGNSVAAKEKPRCGWSGTADELMIAYHDEEWGVPVHDDRKQFEFLTLESAQAGLSWAIVLRKREGYRRAFAEFDPEKVARFTSKRIEQLIADPGIIRNRLKVTAAVTNARCFLAVQEEFGTFDKYIWGFVGGRPIQNRIESMKQIRATSPESDALSKDLKQRGFKFVGSTIVYAHMQAVGMVNDHLVSCFRHKPCGRLR
jgi:DNA-3-methyladenine glycosylase I